MNELLHRLFTTGFAIPSTNPHAKFANPFQEVFNLVTDAKNYTVPLSEIKEFHVDVTKKFDNKQDQVDFRLRFKYDPNAGDISLLTILAKMDNVKRIVLIGENRPFPSAAGIYDTLKKAWIRKRTQHIAPSTRNPHKRKL